MLNYRVYRLNLDGRIMRADYVAAADDEAAILAVRAQASKTACEIWLDKRKVAVIPAGGGEPARPE